MKERNGGNSKKEGKSSLWEKIPDSIKLLAGLITAIATLVTALTAAGILKPSPEVAETPTAPVAGTSTRETAGPLPEPTLTLTSATPTTEQSPSPTPSVTASPSPTPTSTLLAFDSFDDGCIDSLRWRPIQPVEGNPADEIDETNCWSLSSAHRYRETTSTLEFLAKGQSSDGLERIRTACTFTDVEIIVSRFALYRIYEDRNASGYVGLVLYNPDQAGSPRQVSIWLTGRITPQLTSPRLRLVGNLEIEGIPDMPTEQTLRSLPIGEVSENLSLGIHLRGGSVYGSLGGDWVRLTGVEMGAPYGFRLIFGTTSGSILESNIEEVLISWDANRIGAPDCPMWQS